MLEFIIVLPFLLTLTFGIIEFGNTLMTFNTLNKLTMDAARFLSIYAKQGNGTYSVSSNDKTAAFNLMNCGMITTCSTSSLNDRRFLNPSLVFNNFTVTPLSPNSNSTGKITLSLTYSYQPIFSRIFGTNILPNFTLVSNSTIQAL